MRRGGIRERGLRPRQTPEAGRVRGRVAAISDQLERVRKGGIRERGFRPRQTPEAGLLGRLRAGAAGAVAATVWGLQEPLDSRIARSDYSDVAILGKALTRGRHWRPVGLAVHAANGALFGLTYYEARRRLTVGPQKLALGMALAEHVAFYPLSALIDRYHPARGEPGVPRLLTNRTAFAQATWRHALFGIVLGRLA